MKTLIISLSLVALSSSLIFSQPPASGRLELGDSAKVEAERAVISRELIQLRDSITLSIKQFDSRIKKAKADKKTILESAQNDLVEYRNRVKFDLQETSLTAEKAWTAQSVERIRTNTTATRREFNRIKKMITG
ncbi:hypothetical protein BH10BAC4_BH10BAC4_17710 [soil metagenome]